MEIRTFIAVDINEDSRRKVAAYIGDLRSEFPNLRVGWDKPEKLHLTLKFLGDTNKIQLANLREIVERIASNNAKFNLRLLDTGVFPSAKKARVLWIDVKDEQGSLKKLNREIENECEKIGFEKESRKFVPHLTIARLKESEKSAELVKMRLATNFKPVEFEVSEIVIYESKLQPTGSIYSKLLSVKLY